MNNFNNSNNECMIVNIHRHSLPYTRQDGHGHAHIVVSLTGLMNRKYRISFSVKVVIIGTSVELNKVAKATKHPIKSPSSVRCYCSSPVSTRHVPVARWGAELGGSPHGCFVFCSRFYFLKKFFFNNWLKEQTKQQQTTPLGGGKQFWTSATRPVRTHLKRLTLLPGCVMVCFEFILPVGG